MLCTMHGITHLLFLQYLGERAIYSLRVEAQAKLSDN